jgi:SanA protein
MYLDYAGVRTLDSVIRAKEVFGLDSFTIISQPFHNARALFLARHHGESPIAYNAPSVRFSDAPAVYVRELGSRIVALYDAYFETDPKFGGKKIDIEFNPDIRPVPPKICTPRA